MLTKIFIFLFLSIIVIFTQLKFLEPHLQYGFSDVDWGYLSIYKTTHPFSLSQFINYLQTNGTTGGVYTHQIYYLGLQGDLFGLDFRSYNLTMHIFKILATIFIYPVFLIISGSSLIAFVSTILFAFSYSAVGTMYSIATSSDYSAVFGMNIFLIAYLYIIKNSIASLWKISVVMSLLLLTLFLSTERMYPLPLFLIIIELFLVLNQKSWSHRKIIYKRMTIIILPLLLVFLAKPIIFLDFFLRTGIQLMTRIVNGNWNLLLTPFIALGSIVVPFNATHLLGVAKIDNFLNFFDFFISGPLPVLFLITFLASIFIFRRPQVILFQIMILTIVSSVFLYITASHFVDNLLTMESITQALVGFYTISFALVSFKYWLQNKDHSLIGLFAGPLFAFLYTFLTWLGAATSEVFFGAHRYLTIPALLMSLFLGTLFSLICLKMFNFFKNFRYIKLISFTPFIFIILFINLNVGEVNTFFSYQLYNGFGVSDQQYMRSQFNSYLNDLSGERPSLFYFDFSGDNLNSYYYDNTIRGGFNTWMLWNSKINFNKALAPDLIWNQPQVLKSSVTIRDGKKGFLYNGKFYVGENFYAFKLKDRKVIDIKDTLLKEFEI